MSVRLDKEYARLIKPTRNHTPTEYNLRYKKWPHHSEDLRKAAQHQGHRKGKLVKAGRIWSSSKPTKLFTTNSGTSLRPKSPTLETTGKGVTALESDSSISRVPSHGEIDFGEDKNLTSTLQTTPAHLHFRPRSHTNGYDPATVDNSAERDESASRPVSCMWERGEIRIPSTCRGPLKKPRKAWLDKEESENLWKKKVRDDISMGIRHLNVQLNRDQLASIRLFPDSKHERSDSIDEARQLPSPRGTLEYEQGAPFPKEEDMTSDWRHYFPEEDHAIPRLKPGVKSLSKTQDLCSSKRKKNIFGDRINEENLRKIYAGANEDELRRLKQALNNSIGSSHSPERAIRKQYTSTKNDSFPGMTEEQLMKEDLNRIRVAAFRSNQQASGYCLKGEWTTSYSADYCRNFTTRDIVKPPSKDNETTVHAMEKNNDKEPEIKEHFKSKDFRVEGDENETGQEEDEESDSCEKDEIGTCEEDLKEKSFGEELITELSSSSSAEKILKDAHHIEEREFRNLFEGDGKPKMKFETTFEQTFKKRSQPCRKAEEPAWANPTVISLGSGHWNLLRDHYDGWEVQGEGSKDVVDMIPKRDDSKKYKIKIYEQGEPCPSKERITEDMVMGKYGGSGKPRKTNINFVTEYMGKFTHMPLPVRKVRT